jgi:hypothetical protein
MSKYSRHRCRPVIGNIPGSVPWILSVVLAPMMVLPFANLSSPPRVEPVPPPAQVETRINAEGFDRQHRALPFTLYVLTQQFSWKLESTADLEGGETLLNAELTDAINHGREVFCVGTASFEGARGLEEARAAERARTLAEWVRTAIVDPSKTRVFALNAGQYVGPKELESSYQRKAIIIATGQHEEDVDLREALTSGLERQQQTSPLVYNLLHQYSRSNEWLRGLVRHVTFHLTRR